MSFEKIPAKRLIMERMSNEVRVAIVVTNKKAASNKFALDISISKDIFDKLYPPNSPGNLRAEFFWGCFEDTGKVIVRFKNEGSVRAYNKKHGAHAISLRTQRIPSWLEKSIIRKTKATFKIDEKDITITLPLDFIKR